MVSEIVKVLHVSTVSMEKIIPESFRVYHVSPRWVCKNVSAHDRCQWVASSQELLGSCTCDKELLSSFGYWGQNADLPLSPIKQIRIHAVEERGSPHIYRTDLRSLVSWSKEWQMFLT